VPRQQVLLRHATGDKGRYAVDLKVIDVDDE
jgi:hypothetical protein